MITMPRRKSKTTTNAMGYITINDFANNDKLVKRSSKINSSKNIVRHEDSIVNNFSEEVLSNEENPLKIPLQSNKNEKTKLEAPDVLKKCENNSDILLPPELWSIIAEKLEPEDIGTFARICKSTYQITRVKKFWISFYNRYYEENISLPEKLSPEYMERTYCLRANVIRMLFRIYPPFSQRLVSKQISSKNFEQLIGYNLGQMWFDKCYDKSYKLYFKFYKKSETKCHQNRQRLVQDINGDFYKNPDQDSKMLLISSSEFIRVQPLIIGKMLLKSRHTVSRDMKHLKFQMTFGSYLPHRRLNFNDDEMIITLEEINNVKVIPWWHPNYPLPH